MPDNNTVYYTDENNDDFAATNGKIKTKRIGADYRYIHRDPVWHFFAFILYRIIATPIAFIFCRVKFGLKIKNRRVLKQIKGGYFLYGNHTQYAADAFIPSLLSFPRKMMIIVSPDAVSIPGVGSLVPMLGAVPLSASTHGRAHYMEALGKMVARGHAVTIYPEAHIWPYYNKIRPFNDASFLYPEYFNVPAVGFTVTYRQRRFLSRHIKNLHPHITVTLSEPVYPDDCSSRKEMRDKIYDFMVRTAASEESWEYIKYKKSC